MLIRTKLKAPSLKSPMLYRKDLIKKLCAAKEHPFILISGPAGSGKTLLACQWIEKVHLKTGWYSLDREDNDPDLFYRYLLAAFIRADQTLNKPLSPMLAKQQQLTGDTVIPLIIESLCDANQKIQLILDDFHHIENKTIHNALARLMQYIPALLQLVILSRYRLPAAIDAVALKKERLEITASDLKFTEAETADLFRKVIPVAISAGRIRKMNQYVEGWAAGLQLIGMEIRSKGSNFDLSKILNQAHDQIAGYLIHDIIGMLPEKIRSFILTTVLLDRFNPDVCAEVTGLKNAVKLLTHIERMNLFLVPLDDHGRWYRYHHMFSEVVRRQITIDDPDLIPATLQKAATWFATNNHIEDAMRSAFSSGDFEFAADLMEDHIFQYIEHLNPSGGLRWIRKLPADILNQRILLRLYQCQILMPLMEFSKIKESLATIESLSDLALQRYSDEKQTLCKDYIIFHKCILETFDANRSDDIGKLLSMGRQISPQNRFLYSAIEFSAVFAYIQKGELALAEESLAKVSKQIADFDLMVKRIYYDKAKALIARLCGHLHRAEAIINQAQQDLTIQGLQNKPMAFILPRHLGYIYYLQNRLAEARQCATLTVRYSEYSYLSNEMMGSSELRLLLHLADDEKEQADECMKQLRSYAAKFGIPKFSMGLDACAARIAIDQGNLGPAVIWSHRRDFRANEPFSLLLAMEGLTQARLYYAQGKYADAVDLLTSLRNQCLKKNLLELVLQIDILSSAALHSLNCHQKAKSILTNALAFSEIEGYVRPFVNDAKQIEPVLRDIAEDLYDGSFSFYLKTVFSACDIPLYRCESPNGDDICGYESLTKREIEILKWMAQGAKNKEIAQKASISISTVKTHVHRILAKLDVPNRTQAVLKIKEMNIH